MFVSFHLHIFDNQLKAHIGDTSAERQNKDALLSMVLRICAFVKNAVTFLKLNSFTNTAICNNRTRKSSALIYKGGYYK